ncbi:phosphomevalonate kinase [Gnomoniopsis smithogilvyi]|uniref:phosphomevalonate kinase n=1 Tax=Gnomoniopsis smithogilvyi TaxID=1191159 RepID=A0A9W8YJH0_9PEZI|nr:phosphomevalonate kinase [Gnomoniopsis smithogilvyi]
MTVSENPTSAVSAPGKVLLAGGYLVTDRHYTGLVFGLDARINVLAQEISTSQGVQLSEIVVDSPQFVAASWRYGYHLAPEDGGITVTQLQVLTPSRLTILADSSYYSAPTASPDAKHHPSPPNSRFIHMQTPISSAKKTGLGSSAALVTSLTAALLSHYLHPIHFDLTSDKGRSILHNLAQIAHCRAQGKIGSGFDVAAAVYGSCLYRRFSPAILDKIPQPGQPGFGTKLEEAVKGQWDTELLKDKVSLPTGVAMRMVDVECGSQTVGMVKNVNAWRAADPEGSNALWAELQTRNEELASVLAEGKVVELPAALRTSRELVKKMGVASRVPIEPDSQTDLINALSEIEGVYGGVVPGAGGFDAVAVLVRDDDETTKRLESFLEEWSREKEANVKLLRVRGELEGVRSEKVGDFEGWL